MGRKRTRFNCKDCGIKLDEFNTIWENAYKKRPTCKICTKKNKKEYDKKKRDPNNDGENNLSSKYNLTLEEYNKLLEFQQGGCAICRLSCKSGRNLAVDHNHITGEIRGLLCFKCNATLGSINESENLIWNMLEYLKRTTWKLRAVS